MKYLAFPFLIFIILMSSCKTKAQLVQSDTTEQVMKDIMMLSSDEMEGREVGTKGEKLAAEYLANRMKNIGLVPKGDNGTFLQEFSKKTSSNPHLDETADGNVIVGYNLLGYINNNKPHTVVIGAHYDHLGYGGFGSMHKGEPAIHSGADDNASGVAGVLRLAEQIKKLKDLNYNYLFILFSGEERGLWGSNIYVNKKLDDKSMVNYMVNLDMIGRLKENNLLSVSGVGSSDQFDEVLDKSLIGNLTIKKQSTGIGGSDHASFYNAGIPVLSFFSGMHLDYHKPTDTYEKINYKGLVSITDYILNVVKTLDGKPKQLFVKAASSSNEEQVSFKVTMGIMPDYMYEGKGVRVEGTREEKPAANAGIEKGDIITKIGDLEIIDMQAYMKALSSFKSGDTIDVMIKRNNEDLLKKVTF